MNRKIVTGLLAIIAIGFILRIVVGGFFLMKFWERWEEGEKRHQEFQQKIMKQWDINNERTRKR